MIVAEIAAEADAPPKDALTRARTIAIGVLTGELVLLVATGIALFFVYRPSGGGAWAQMGFIDRSEVRAADVMRATHRLVATLAIPTALVTGALLAVRRGAERRPTGVALGFGIPLTVLLLSFTGYLLPWDQLGLWSVTVGTSMSGYQPLFGDQVRFVIMGTSEVATRTVVRWLVVHMLVLGPLLIGMVATAWWRFVKLRWPRSNPPIVPPQY